MEYEVEGGLGERLFQKTVRHENCTGWMLWIAVDGGSG